MDSRIILFPNNATKMDMLGDIGYIAMLDDICLEDKVTLSLTSNHILQLRLDANLDLDLINKIAEKQHVKIKTQGLWDYYTIVSIEEGLYEVNVSCRHWTIEAQNSMYIVDSKPRNLSSAAMMDHLKQQSEQYKTGADYARNIEVCGNITDTVSTNIYRDNFYNATNDLMGLYNAECKREAFKVELLDYVGSKEVRYQVEYANNLIDNTSNSNFDFIIGVHPTGYNGIAGNIVYSGKLQENPNLVGITKKIEYKVRVREEGKEDEDGYTYYDTEEEAKTELERLAAEEFTVNRIDYPIVEHTTKFLDLSTVDEAESDVKVWLNVGDKINTIIPKYNLNIDTRIIEMVIINDIVEDITLSNNDVKNLIPPTISSIQKEVGKLPSVNDVIEIAKKESETIVNQGFNGFVHYKPNYTAWTDTEDIKQSRQGLCANKAGWFFYKNGIDTETGYPNAEGSTMIADISGNFNASCINSGEINANLIRTGSIRNYDGTVEIDLNKEFVEFKRKGNKSIDINGNRIFFYDWEGTSRTEPVGRVYSARTSSIPGLAARHDANAILTLAGLLKSGLTTTYLRGDADRLVNTNADLECFTSFWIRELITNSLIKGQGIAKYNKSTQNILLTDSGNIAMNCGTAQVNGSLAVTGNKNCIQPTENYGDRLFYSVEDCESYLTDRSMKLLTVEETESGTFEKVILLDSIFKEAVNLEHGYTVEVIKQGWGDYRIKEQNENYFIVESDRKDFTFKYVVTAKRKGYEGERLKEYIGGE